MERISISHWSNDRELTARLLGGLRAQGFEGAFLDFDKNIDIPPGARARSQCSSAGSTHGGLSRSAAALPASANSNACWSWKRTLQQFRPFGPRPLIHGSSDAGKQVASN